MASAGHYSNELVSKLAIVLWYVYGTVIPHRLCHFYELFGNRNRLNFTAGDAP